MAEHTLTVTQTQQSTSEVSAIFKFLENLLDYKLIFIASRVDFSLNTYLNSSLFSFSSREFFFFFFCFNDTFSKFRKTDVDERL